MWKPRSPHRPLAWRHPVVTASALALAGAALALTLALTLAPGPVAQAEDAGGTAPPSHQPAGPAAIARGKAFAEANCAGCHAIGPTGDSPLAGAPPFRDLHQRYPVDSLAESLAEGIVTGHSGMPEFELEPDQIDDFIDYLHSLETASAAPDAPAGK